MVVCPTPPALLDDVATTWLTDDVAALQDLKERVVELTSVTADCELLVTIAAGEKTAIHTGGTADLRPYGVPDKPRTWHGNADAAARLCTTLDVPIADGPLPLGIAVLTRIFIRGEDLNDDVRASRQRHIGIVVRRGDEARVAEALLQLLTDVDVSVGVIVQGDLAASPLRRTDSSRGNEATVWDEAALPLLHAGDRTGWAALEPGDVEPLGLAPLGVAMAVLGDRWQGQGLYWSAPRGVGAVVGIVSTP